MAPRPLTRNRVLELRHLIAKEQMYGHAVEDRERHFEYWLQLYRGAAR